MTDVDPWTLRTRQAEAAWRLALGAARSVLPEGATAVLRTGGGLAVAYPMSRWAWLGLGAVHVVVGSGVRDRVQTAVMRYAGFRPRVEVRWIPKP